jgi:hypothetical protein
MTSKERVAAVFEHRSTDKVPIYMGSMSSRVASMVLGREAYVGGGAMQYKESAALWEGEDAHKEYLERCMTDALDLARALDVDYVRPSYWRLPVKPTRKIDEYTYFYGNEGGSWYIKRYDPDKELYQTIDSSPRPEITIDDLERYVERAEKSAASYQPKVEQTFNLQNAINQLGDTKAIHGAGIGISIPWYNSYGNELWLEAAIVRPDLVGRYLDVLVARAEKNIAMYASVGIPYLHGGGDFAGKNGPVYSPKVFRELMLPRLQKVSEACRRHGCYHMFASDGNLWSLADDLFGRSGIEGYYEIDKDCDMDLATLRRRFPHLTLLGGISSARLHLGTLEDVKDEVMSALKVANEEGSIIVGCSNMVVPGTPEENFKTMMELLHKHR